MGVTKPKFALMVPFDFIDTATSRRRHVTHSAAAHRVWDAGLPQHQPGCIFQPVLQGVWLVTKFGPMGCEQK